MGQVQETQNQSSNKILIDGGLKTLPTCLLLVGEYPTFTAKLSNELYEQGIFVKIVSNFDEVLEEETAPEVFAVLVNLSQFPQAPAVLKQRSPDAKTFWIALSTKITGQNGAVLLSNGFSELLPWPSHPSSVKGRARMLLSKYVRKYSMPEDVVLPSGMQRPDEGGSRSLNSSGNTPEKKLTASSTNSIDGIFVKGMDAVVISSAERGNWRPLPKPEKYNLSSSDWDALKNAVGPLPNLINEANTVTIRTLRFNEAGQTASTCVVWTEGRSVSGTFQVKKYIAGKGLLHLAYPLNLDREQIVRKLKTEGTEDLHFNLRLRGSSMLFRQSINKIIFSADGLFVDVNSDLFEVQRRRDFRVERSGKFKFDAKVKTVVNGSVHEFSVPVKDLSAGGMCIFVPKMLFQGLESKLCTVGHVNFQLGQEQISLAVVPKWQREVKPSSTKSTYLVGLEFSNVEPKVAEKVQELVFDLALDYLKKFRMNPDSAV